MPTPYRRGTQPARHNEQVGGQRVDRQNVTLDQPAEAHAALPELVRLLEEDLRDQPNQALRA